MTPSVTIDSLEQARDKIEELERNLDTAMEDLDSAVEEAAGAHAQLARLKREATAQPNPAPDPEESIADQPGRVQYPNLRAWVDGWLCTTIERAPSSTVRWCPQWQQHPEAVMRLGQVFADYTKFVSAPKMDWGNFLRNSLDVYLPAVLAPTGPFASCDPHNHEAPMFLATTKGPTP